MGVAEHKLPLTFTYYCGKSSYRKRTLFRLLLKEQIGVLQKDSVETRQKNPQKPQCMKHAWAKSNSG